MIFEKIDEENLKKLNTKSILDLALILPTSYEDLSLNSMPNLGFFNTTQIDIKFIKKSFNILKISAFSQTWKNFIQITIFNPKPFHSALFKPQKSLFIYGKCEEYFGVYNFINPKVVQDVGRIIFKFKQKLKDNEILLLKQKYINEKNLLKFGLNKSEIKKLILLNEVSKKSINEIFSMSTKTLNFLKFIEILNYLIKLDSKKIELKAEKLTLFDIDDWIKSLNFNLTHDQISAIKDIKSDFGKKIASKRVVMGDVGSGKSIIIFASALLIYPKVSILMAPTSVLANQLFNEAKKLLPSFIKIKLLKSGEMSADFKDFNFIISTHALLYQNLPKASLIMIDEQHKFGTNARQKFKLLTQKNDISPHFLQFSATPIPRTLSLIESNLVDFSFLKTLPFKKEIKTYNIKNSDFANLLSHIKKVISKNLQVAIIYPLIEQSQNSIYQSLNQACSFWQKNFQNVYQISAQDKNKDEIMKEFNEKGDILLATTVIEVGISLERLNTIVIVGAEKFGLSTLHQLRGRVARNGGVGFCFLYTKLTNTPQRLIDFSQTNDGFEVANIDLMNRQSGDLLEGKIQHGKTFNFYNYEEDITNLAKKQLDKLNKN